MTRHHIPIGSDVELLEEIGDSGGGGAGFGTPNVGDADTSFTVEAVAGDEDAAVIDLKRSGGATVGEIVVEQGVTLYELVDGETHSATVSGGKFEVAKIGPSPTFTYTPIFRIVFSDGSIHIPNGASIVADL